MQTSQRIEDAGRASRGATATVRHVPTPEDRTAAGGRAPELLCRMCWETFPDAELARCPACDDPRPPDGWTSMPFRLREQFEFVDLLGRGAMGAVFRSVDLTATPDAQGELPVYAVKVVQAVGGDDAVARLRSMFEHEAAVATLLGQSAHFVGVSGHGLGELPYLVMEFVAWPTLKKVLEAGPLSPLQVARLGVALLEAVEVMHFYRVVHRDLKPSNVFAELQGAEVRVKVADLGIWTQDHDAAPPDPKQDEGRLFVGTLPYMSPEQMACEPVGCRSDLHAVASILWEATTGAPPYPSHGDDLRHEIGRRRRACRTLPTRPAQMPEGLYAVLQAGLRWDPEERPASAREMAAQLQAFLQAGAEMNYDASNMLAELAGVRAAALELLAPLQGAGALAERVVQILASLDSLVGHLDSGGSLDPGVFDSARRELSTELREIGTQASTLWRPGAAARPTGETSEAPTAPGGPPPEALGAEPRATEEGREPALSDHYERLRLVSTGSLAKVYEGRQPALDRRVALKVMGRNAASGMQAERQARLFRVQAGALARLQHPNTVRVYDLGMGSDGLPFVVMEYLQGVTAAEYLQRSGVLEERGLLLLFEPVVASLQEAHARGVLHLNLKPRNIFLKALPGGERVPKVLSYGWPSEGLQDLLPPGMVLGTPRYMSPEQIRGLAPGPGADLYALGTMLYEALVGHPPYMEDGDVRALLAAKLARPCVPLPELGPGGPLSHELRAVVHALLVRDPSDRPSDAGEALGWLQALVDGRPGEVPVRDLAGRRRRDLV